MLNTIIKFDLFIYFINERKHNLNLIFNASVATLRQLPT